MRQSAAVGHISKSKLYLPDVTGLTSAVESPMKGGLQHYPFNVSKEARESNGKPTPLTELQWTDFLKLVYFRLSVPFSQNSDSWRQRMASVVVVCES